MAKPEKSNLPAYISYSAFISFINGLRETHIPMQIDRSVMPKASGSQISAMIVSLKFLHLIDENNKPLPLMKQLVEAADEARGPVIEKAIDGAYGFLLSDGEFDLEKATGQLVAEKFRAQGISGSTMSKAIAFFLAAAKDAGIKVSPHIKPPAIVRTEGKRISRRKGRDPLDDLEIEDDEFDQVADDMEKFQIPIPGKASATVIIPKNLSADDWAMLTMMLNAYVKRLQEQQTK